MLVSGGSLNRVASFVVAQIIEEGALDTNLAALRAAYRARVDALDAALTQHFGGIARWVKPQGGYFFWLELPESVDVARLAAAARECRTGFLTGSWCSPSGGMQHCIRLSFAHYPPEMLQAGVVRLRRALP